MNRMHRCTADLAVACAAAWALVACGGGGGGSSAGTAANGAAVDRFAAQDAGRARARPATSRPTACNWINYRRSQIGMPALTRRTPRSTARPRAIPITSASTTSSPTTKTAGKPGFTGASLAGPPARGRLRSSAPPNTRIGEVISATSNGSGFYMAEELITAIYHRFVDLRAACSRKSAPARPSPAPATPISPPTSSPTTATAPASAAGTLVTWPFNGQTEVPANFFSDYEEPDPVPDAQRSGLPGQRARRTSTAHADGAELHDPRARRQHDLAVAPAGPGPGCDTGTRSRPRRSSRWRRWRPRTTYDVTFIGTVDGIPVTRDLVVHHQVGSGRTCDSLKICYC